MAAKKVKVPTIAERNAAYKLMSPREKAVAVAKDVISQLVTKKYVATNFTYFKLPRLEDSLISRKVLANSLQEVLEEEKCSVCAIGATFASCVRLGNSAKTDGILNTDNDTKYMFTHTSAAFTTLEMRAMEMVFEGDVELPSTLTMDMKKRCVNYRNTLIEDLKLVSVSRNWQRLMLPEPTQLMTRIMQNVIDNDGLFLVEGLDLRNTSKE